MKSWRQEYWIFIFLLGGILSCNSESSNPNTPVKNITMSEHPSEISIPPEVWDLLEERKVINSQGKQVPRLEAPHRLEENVFVGMIVHLREKTPGILGGANIDITSERSGMKIDLAEYLKYDKGTFILSFEPDSPIDSKLAQVLFINQSIQREESHQRVGGGCGRYFDITRSYLNEFWKGGVEVNVTNGRHISFLGGTFLIRVSNEKGVRALTQLTITDSRYPLLLCSSNKSLGVEK